VVDGPRLAVIEGVAVMVPSGLLITESGRLLRERPVTVVCESAATFLP